MNKKITVLIVLLFFIFIAYLNTSNLPKGSDLKKFDSIIWQNESSIQPDKNFISEREKMLEDLVENILPRKNKNEIEKLLGKPLKTPYFSSSDKDLIYYLGPERDNYMNIDSEWLLIWLDEANKFQKYKVVND